MQLVIPEMATSVTIFSLRDMNIMQDVHRYNFWGPPPQTVCTAGQSRASVHLNCRAEHNPILFSGALLDFRYILIGHKNKKVCVRTIRTLAGARRSYHSFNSAVIIEHPRVSLVNPSLLLVEGYPISSQAPPRYKRTREQWKAEVAEQAQNRKLFVWGDHPRHDPQCSRCYESPSQCSKCGGVVHNEVYDYACDPEDTPILRYECGKCKSTDWPY